MSCLRASAKTVLLLALLGAGACDDSTCPSDRFQVLQTGSCSDGPTYIELVTNGCHVGVVSTTKTGLPTQGALGSSETPLRQGDFILYGDTPTFRLCHAKRVDYQLNVSCVDSHGAPVCEAVLTEPP